MKLFNKLRARLARLNANNSAYKFMLKDWTRLSDLDALSRVLDSKRFSQNLEPIVMEHPQGKRILVLAPHPDDDIFGAGGVLLKSVRHGVQVKTACITTGEQPPPPKPSPTGRGEGEGIAHIREEEAQQVARALGTEVEFWQCPARLWRVDETVKERLRTVVKEWNPDTIFLPFLADDHEDHRRTSQLFYETFKDVSPRCEVWAYQVYSTVLPNVIVDITDVLEDKLKLVRLHQSQMERRDWAHYIRGLNALNSRFLKTNEPRYAEMFLVVPAQEYLKLCQVYFKA